MSVKGTVKWFNEKRGYGFIQQENGDEIFVHFSAINSGGYRKLNEGQKVLFQVENGPRGAYAVEVTKVN